MNSEEMFLPSEENFRQDQVILKNGFTVHNNGMVDTSDITLNSFYDAKRIAYLSAGMQVGKMLSTYDTLVHIKEQLSTLPIYTLEYRSLGSSIMSEKYILAYIRKNGFTQHRHHYAKSTNNYLKTSMFPDSYREANRFMKPEYRQLTYHYAALASCLELNAWVTEKIRVDRGRKPEFGTPYLNISYGTPIIPYPDNCETHFRPRYSTISIRVERFGIDEGEIKGVINFHKGSHTYIIPIFSIPKSLDKNVLYKVYDSEVHNLNKNIFRSNSTEEYNEHNFRSAFYHVSQRQKWNTAPSEMLTQHYTTVATWDDVIADLNVPYEQWRENIIETVQTNIATLWENYEQWTTRMRSLENTKYNSMDDVLAKGQILADEERLKESLKIITRNHSTIAKKIDKAKLVWNESLYNVIKRV